MSGVRRLLLDTTPGELRGVVLLDGRPERLLIERDGEPPRAELGDLFVGRVTALAGDRVFVELGVGPAGLARLGAARAAEGAAVEVEVVAEAHAEKGPRLRLVGPAEGGPRLLSLPHPPAARLRALAPHVEIETGEAAREAADLAEEAATAVEHRFRGGLVLAVESTRALTAIDVDLAAGGGAGDKRVREANLSAIRHAARLVRLKGLGGMIVIDLLGFPAADQRGLHRAEAARAFAADGEEVEVAAPDRFGLLHVSKPRRERPIAEVLLAADGRPSARTIAQRLLRELEREGRAHPGARLSAVCPPDVAAALRPLLSTVGGLHSVREVAEGRLDAHISRL